MQIKTCKVCGELKRPSEFSVNRAKDDGLHYNCKPCDAAKARMWYNKNANRSNAAKKERRNSNLDVERTKDRAWYEANKGIVLERRKNYYEANKEHIVQRTTNWGKQNRDKTRQYLRNHYKNNRTQYMARSAVRRASKIAATPSWLSAIELAQIQEMYDVAEALTMQTGMKHHVDHIHPLKGCGFYGLHAPWNLRVITAFDNLSKGNRLPDVDAHMAWEA